MDYLGDWRTITGVIKGDNRSFSLNPRLIRGIPGGLDQSEAHMAPAG